MTLNGWIQILVFTLLVLALVKPLGGYMTRVFKGEPHGPLAGPSPPRARALCPGRH